MRFAYADPPYEGCAHLYRDHPDYGGEVDHPALIERLCREFPDGWALSMKTGSLRGLLPLCPPEARVGSWVKPFASFKPGVPVAYAWEPVVFCGGRPRSSEDPTVRDWIVAPAIPENITLRRGLTGAKPRKVCWWIFDVLGMQPGDDLADLFPGTGAVAAAWEAYCNRGPGQLTLTSPEAA